MYGLVLQGRNRSHRNAPGSPRGALLRRALTLAAAASLASVGLAGAPATVMAATHTAAAKVTGARPPVSGNSADPVAGEPALAVPHSSLPSDVHRACPPSATAGMMSCMALLRTNVKHPRGLSPKQTISGYAPSSLQSAYNLTTASTSNGAGVTVAIVDAYSDPSLASDYAVYRSEYGLPACNPPTTNEGCLTIVSQTGQSSPLPPANVAWASEESTDVDMVSAICPNCNILMIEADSSGFADLGTAENEAITMGAQYVSNSWSGAEFGGESYYDYEYFDHPGAALVFAAPDAGYGTAWPTSSQFVTSVGGTSLTQATGGAWQQTAYAGSGSGCSSQDPKPVWQTMDDTQPDGCLNRTMNDVSAVANPADGVATYNTYVTAPTTAGWQDVGGTSVSAPIIASVYALAGPPAAGTYPASYPYQSTSSQYLTDVTSGSNGGCEAYRQYLCNAEPGFDGPTGLGTPNGTGAFAFSPASQNVVTLDNPGTIDDQATVQLDLQMQGIDSGAGQTLAYTATGLPSGVSISSSGLITGTTKTVGTSTIMVTATDTAGATGSVMFSLVEVGSMATSYHGGSGPVALDTAGMCMDDTLNHTTDGNKIQIYKCNGQQPQIWTYEPSSIPGQAGTITIHGRCLDILNRGRTNGSLIDLWSCNGGWNQQWLLTGGGGELYNPTSQKCLTDPNKSTKNGTQLTIYTCSGDHIWQAWIPPASPVQSGVSGMCMNDAGNGTKNGTAIQIYACNGGQGENWTTEPDQTLRINGKCLDVSGRSTQDGAQLQLYACTTTPPLNNNQHWEIAPSGELINVNSGKCLYDPGNSSANNTTLIQSDCYGQAGELWAVT
jgi:Ricin-type beta-trefoil lectin domain/Putative Ig domain